jgi:hypothetical protein
MAYGVNAPFGLRPVASINGGDWTEKTNSYLIYASDDGATTYNGSIFTGDPVVWNPTLAQAGTISVYLPARTVGTPGTYSALPILGVFMGCIYTDRTTGLAIQSPYWPASTVVKKGTPIIAHVIDDPNVVYDIQVSTPGDVLANANFPTVNATGGNNQYPAFFGRNLALDIGNDIDPNSHLNVKNPATGNTLTGQSAFYAVASSGTTTNPLTNDYIKTTATLPLKVLGYTPNPQNVAGTGLTITTTPFLNLRVTINNHVFGHNSAGTTLA